jgi:leucyl/phenylalanyl-tRNA---protein transferase
MYILSNKLYFPSVHDTDEDGILAIGGDLSPQRLLLAYRNGIFPWYSDDEPITWWCPNPRFVLFPNELVVSKSMKAILKSNGFTFTINKNFTQVIENCKTIFREGQHGTWITDEVQKAYTTLQELGYAISAEAWQNNTLVGGLYGIKLGNVFFGESMFSNVSNASKFAFINFVQYLQTQQVQLIDCQVYTPHLESLGAKMINRNTFIDLLKNLI